MRRRPNLAVSPQLRTSVVPAFVGAFVVAALVTWLTSPRFSITAPSLIDDWSEIRWSPLAFHQVLHLSYDPATYDAQRYRPGLYGFWSEIRWHTLSAPLNLRGPNLWNLVRNGLFGLGLAGIVVAGIRPAVRLRLGPAWLTALAAIPGALVVSTPELTSDFARFGPQEPLLLGGMAVGLVLVLVGVQSLEAGSRGRRGRAIGWMALAIAGVLCWVVGVYQKEASICAALLAPFLVLEMRARGAPGAGVPRLAIWSFSILLALPLVHMLLEVKRLSNADTIVYGATVPHGIGGWYDRLTGSFGQQWAAIAGLVAAPVWQGIAMAGPAVLTWSGLRSRRVPWLPIGLMLVALAVLVFQGLPLVASTRYLIVPFGLLAAAVVLAVAVGPWWVRALAVGGSAALVVANAGPAREVVRQFAAQEQAGVRLVSTAAQLNPSRCPVYLASFDIERTYSLPELLALRGKPSTGCTPGLAGVLLVSTLGGNAADDRILHACAPPGWRPIGGTDLAAVVGCQRFKHTVRGADGVVAPVGTVLEHDRLRIPASPYVTRTPDPAPLQPARSQTG